MEETDDAECIDTLDRASSLDKDLEYEMSLSPLRTFSSRGIQTTESLSNLMEKSVQAQVQTVDGSVQVDSNKEDENGKKKAEKTFSKKELVEKDASETVSKKENEKRNNSEENISKKEVEKGNNEETISKQELDWDDSSLDEFATLIQAGFYGMISRAKMAKEEAEIQRAIDQRSREIEDHLGIDLNDPEIIKATTKIQAGFRGLHARNLLKRPMTPAIFIHKPEEEKDSHEDVEEESEYTYIYEDEFDDDSDDELNGRPDTPTTAIEKFPLTIGGFTTTFGIRYRQGVPGKYSLLIRGPIPSHK